MRLILSNNAAPERSTLTPASLFETKYDWLMRWAMHLAQNDRAVAEDLVQDTFVRLMNSWPRIKGNLHEAEPILYSYLRYSYLTEVRRGRRFRLEELALIEFDDLRLSLKEERAVDPIEMQDDLRRIVAYLCWRKRLAKSASVLLLRFFHGYFPDEIARISLMRRSDVDKLLKLSREEVKAYLADPSRVEIMRQGKPPELMPRQMAVSPERFAAELRGTIFEARTGACLDSKELLRHYRAETPKPIPCELLAHIVSCKVCLDVVHSNSGFPPFSQRSEDGVASLKRRSRRGPGEPSPAPKEEIRRVIAGGMERFRQLYEHRPRSLSIIVDGDALAKRDVSSATSELVVQTGPERVLGIVEVVSEQNIPLLTFYVGAAPPQAPPVQNDEIALSDGRTLGLRLQFTGEGAVIEVLYHDPTLLKAAHGSAESISEIEDSSEDFAAEVPEDKRKDIEKRPRRRSWWRWFLERVTGMELPEMNPLLATAMVCAVAAIVFFVLSLRTASVMKPGELLQRASASENKAAQSGPGVVVETVRIQTPRRKLERTIYRDVQGKRRAKDQKLEQAVAAVRTEMEAVDILWNDPLSADSYRDWHDHVAVERDVVKQAEKGLLTLTTTVAEGEVASESLTVRESDFHPVARTVELRDAGTIEIAELNYSVLPWSSVNPHLFESEVDSLSLAIAPSVHPALLPHLPHTLSPTEIDSAELGARLTLNRMHLDTNDRIEVIRQSNGVHVEGVVESDAEKRQLQAQLYMVSHVSTNILTLREMEEQPSEASAITSIRESSAATTPTPSALERYFSEHGMDRIAAGASVQEFIVSSFAVKRQSEQIAELLSRFASNATLSATARANLSELLIQHKAALLNALEREDRQLVTLHLVPHSTPAAENGQENVSALSGAAERNFALCAELTSDSSTSPNSAQKVAPQLADSIAQLRAIVLRISATAQLYGPSLGSPQTANQNR